MKKLLFTFITILLISIALNGCSDEVININTAGTSTEELGSPTAQVAFKLTLGDIKARYADTEIKNTKNINTEYVLVESQKETFANKFDLYNLKTGKVDTLPTGLEYVSLEKVVNENYFIFLASGRNSESPFSVFPYLIKCFRTNNDANKYGNFIAVHEDKYFDLEESVQAGSKEGSLMSDMNITLDGLEVWFKPVEGNELGFYADATDIPPTKTTYDKNKKQITLEIKTNKLGENLKNKSNIKTENNQFVSSYDIVQKDNKINLVVSLKDSAKKYLIKIKKLPNGNMVDGFPVFIVEFAGNK